MYSDLLLFLANDNTRITWMNETPLSLTLSYTSSCLANAPLVKMGLKNIKKINICPVVGTTPPHAAL